MKFSAETEVVALLKDFLRGKGFETAEEVSSMGQSIDLVGKKNEYLYAFEAKRDNWRKGLSQCRSHELIADYICLAMGSPTITAALSEEVTRLGYGLIWCNPADKKCSWVNKPKLNSNVWNPQKKLLLKSLREYA